MSLLFSNEILAAVTKELQSANHSVQIITAFCKENSLKHLSKYINSDIAEKKIMIRFRLDDLIKGSTDFSILQYCIENHWKVYIRFDLHAKTYIIDDKRGLVGSANATNNGLSISSIGNMEVGTLVDIEPQDIEKIDSLYRDAILVTDDIFEKLKKQYENVSSQAQNKTNLMWDQDIIELFKPHIDTLFSFQLPGSDVDKLSFLDCSETDSKEDLRNALRWSPSYLWLLSVLEENDGCLFFGALTQKLHDTLVSDPKPYRKDVKELLSNLLSMIQELEMPEISIDVPHYSQRIKLRKES